MVSSNALRVPSAIISYFLSFAFMIAGLGKLMPQHPMHAELVSKAPAWADALSLTRVGVSPAAMLFAIGATELILGLLVIATPAAAAGLTVVMIGALVTHFILDGHQFTGEALPAAFLLCCCLVLLALQPILRAAREREVHEMGHASGKDE